MRIVSLIPSATEIVYLLGLQDRLVACSHDSNYPKDALSKPRVTDVCVPTGLTSYEIDRKVRNSLHHGRSLYHIDSKILRKTKPNLVLTQELCEVCAPSYTQIKKAVRILDSDVKLLSLEPESIEDVFENILTVGEYTGTEDKALQLVKDLNNRLYLIKEKTKRERKRPTVVIIEWLDPIMIAGHWVPEMVERAGGKMILSRPHQKSRRARWREVLTANPDILIFAPCGFDIKRTGKEVGMFKKKKGWSKLKTVKNGKVYLVDGDAYLTRSGPRLIQGVQILAKICHPELFGRVSEQEAVQYTNTSIH